METEQRWEQSEMLSQNFFPAKAYFVQKHEAYFLPLWGMLSAFTTHAGQCLVLQLNFNLNSAVPHGIEQNSLHSSKRSKRNHDIVHHPTFWTQPWKILPWSSVRLWKKVTTDHKKRLFHLWWLLPLIQNKRACCSKTKPSVIWACGNSKLRAGKIWN